MVTRKSLCRGRSHSEQRNTPRKHSDTFSYRSLLSCRPKPKTILIGLFSNYSNLNVRRVISTKPLLTSTATSIDEHSPPLSSWRLNVIFDTVFSVISLPNNATLAYQKSCPILTNVKRHDPHRELPECTLWNCRYRLIYEFAFLPQYLDHIICHKRLMMTVHRDDKLIWRMADKLANY